ncbi:hypothetical protein CFD26_100786 [Aspergillus turcosus]|uniref:NADPH--hemoprotein reductase n=1 Tax=Aspergillus turcosus TaxID=1245748 RepID=A0A3R7IC92_9EURO|nr:hypothetical protein CFD26_100786 [Aspergillus turcosus]
MEISSSELSICRINLPRFAESCLQLRIGDWLVLLCLAIGLTFHFGSGKVWFKPDPYTHLMYVAPQKSGELKAQPKRTRDIGQRLQAIDADIAIFWGSQSGVSERFAERLSREWRARFSLKTMIADLDDYDPEHLASFPGDKLAVFLISTYGEGDPPDNAVSFYGSLEKMHKKGTRLDTLRYCAMGMGNKNYKYYNRVMKVVDEMLSDLGAQRVGPLGLADESIGTTEESFMEWKDEIIEHLKEIITIQERPLTYEPSIEIVGTSVDANLVYLGEPSEKALLGMNDRVAYNATNPYPAILVQSRKLSSLQDRVCMHMEFDLSAVPALRYQTGDHLAVWPINANNEVNRLLRVLGLDDEFSRKQPITIKAKEGAATNCSLPSPTTREVLLKYYLEIGGLVSRDFLMSLSQFAPTDAAKDSLLRLAKSKEAFRNEVTSRYLSAGKIMEMIEPKVAWTGVPFTLLVENFNRIQPRRYSISSSPLKQPRQPSITLVVNNRPVLSERASREDQTFFGLATNFLLAHKHKFSSEEQPTFAQETPMYDLNGPRNKLESGKVYIHIKRSTFKLPPNPATPIIMVAAGTGIAPFRGFMQERTRLMGLGKSVGKMILFFGCRDDTYDYLYRDEWREYEERLGDNFVMVPAFSRLPGQKKMYVQDALVERKDVIMPLILQQGAAFYICGSASMAREVRTRLVDILAEAGDQSREDADSMIAGKMKKAGLYHEDVWS